MKKFKTNLIILSLLIFSTAVFCQTDTAKQIAYKDIDNDSGEILFKKSGKILPIKKGYDLHSISPGCERTALITSNGYRDSMMYITIFDESGNEIKKLNLKRIGSFGITIADDGRFVTCEVPKYQAQHRAVDFYLQFYNSTGSPVLNEKILTHFPKIKFSKKGLLIIISGIKTYVDKKDIVVKIYNLDFAEIGSKNLTDWPNTNVELPDIDETNDNIKLVKTKRDKGKIISKSTIVLNKNAEIVSEKTEQY